MSRFSDCSLGESGPSYLSLHVLKVFSRKAITNPLKIAECGFRELLMLSASIPKQVTISLVFDKLKIDERFIRRRRITSNIRQRSRKNVKHVRIPLPSHAQQSILMIPQPRILPVVEVEGAGSPSPKLSQK